MEGSFGEVPVEGGGDDGWGVGWIEWWDFCVERGLRGCGEGFGMGLLGCR